MTAFFGVRFTRRGLRALAGGYAVAAVVATVLLAIEGSRAAELTGLHRQLHSQVGFGGTPLLDDVTPEITLDFLDHDPTLPRRFFSVRWQGFWYVPEPGEVDLHGAGDDRLDVWIDGELVIRRTPPADMHTLVRTLALDAGVHHLRVEYEQHAGAYALALGWAPRGGRARPLPPQRLFREWPDGNAVRLAQRAARLGTIVFVVWAVPAALGAAFLARRGWRLRARWGPESAHGAYWRTGARAAAAAAVVLVAVRACLARLAGWNPESLWADDLVYGAIVRSDSVRDMLAAPIHMAPGPLVIWRGLYALLPDPEWSLQLLPFACGIAAIPLMALVVWRLTADESLAAMAAALTALNPLLAHYTVFVHQYPFDFVVTALFLLAAAALCSGESGIDPRRHGGLAFGGGLAIFCSVTSVFASFPIVNLSAIHAARDRSADRRRTVRILSSAAAYNAAVLAGYLLLRGRSNAIVRDDFAAGFMPLESFGAAWGFLAANGRRMLELGLPNWSAAQIWDPATVSWPLPFLGLGLAWLLARRSTRFCGLVVGGFYAAFVVASALGVYPLGTGRPDIFAFPVAIALFAAGIHLSTTPLPQAGLFRLAAAATVVTIAVANPLRAEYWDVDDVHLVAALEPALRPDDGLILSPTGAFLVAFYGGWPVTIGATDRHSHGTMATIGRERTLYLFRGPTQAAEVTRFLAGTRPERTWYVAFRTGDSEAGIVEAIEAQRYRVREVRETQRGRLYLAERRHF